MNNADEKALAQSIATGLENARQKALEEAVKQRYKTNNPKLKVSVADGYKILYVKVVFTISNTAILKLGDATVASGELVEIAGTPASVEFTVGNSTSATNGQIKVKGITVVYMANA